MNEQDLHDVLGELARRGADEQAARMARGDGLSAPRAVAVAGARRRRRAALVTGGSVAAVAALTLSGFALVGQPDPQPAGPTPAPSPTVTAPAPSASPEPSPSGTAQPDDGDEEAPEAAGAVLRPYPTAPSVAWTTPASAFWSGDTSLLYGDVTAIPHTVVGFRAVSAGGTWLLAAGEPHFEDLVAVDAATGAILWRLPAGRSADPDATSEACVGVHDGLLVCQGVAGDHSVVQLRDPVTGRVVRSTPAADPFIAMTDGALVTHGARGRDLHVTVTDLATGAVRAELTVPGVVGDLPEGMDGQIVGLPAGRLLHARDDGHYAFTLDTRTNTLLDDGFAPAGARADGWAFRTAPDGRTDAVGPDGQHVALPGTDVPLVVWAPDRGITVPLLSGSDPGDGRPDQVSAVDPATGSVVWSVPGAAFVHAVSGRTAVLAGDELVAVDVLSGAELWRAPLGIGVVGADGTRVVIRRPGELQALDLRDGSVAWTVATGESQVEVVDGTLVLVAPDGSLSALPAP